MLVLSRKVNENIVIDGNIRVYVLSIHGDKVKLGIDAPPRIRVDREEIADLRKLEQLPPNTKLET